MRYTDILNRLSDIYSTGEARSLMMMVLDMEFGLNSTDVYCGKVNELSDKDAERLDKIIKHLENHEPVQYILGKAEFCGHTFHVEPGVLIPRPETEELVELALSLLATNDNPRPRILDVGTGSGCIAISVAKALPDAQVDAWDVSDDALRIASSNAESMKANVRFDKVDALSYDANGKAGQYDMIISNPPYICHSEADEMEENVLSHEPHLALFVPDDDPLLFYRAIAESGRTMLKDGGHLLFEINRAYCQETKAMLEAQGYSDIVIHNDQFENPRMISCYVNQ